MTTRTAEDQLWFLDALTTVHVSAAEGEDGISVIESTGRRGDSPPLHVHHTEDEVFQVLNGTLRVRLGDDELTAGAGEILLAPKGIPHTYRVESEEATWTAITTNGDFEAMVRKMSRPAERPELPEPTGPPSPDQIAALERACREHSIEFVGPPLS